MTHLDKIVFENKFKIQIVDQTMILTLKTPSKQFRSIPTTKIDLSAILSNELDTLIEKLTYCSEDEFMTTYRGKEF